MKYLLSLLFVCDSLFIGAQVVDPHLSYETCKTVSFGYTQTGISAKKLNEMLSIAGYPSLPRSMGGLTLGGSADLSPHFGMFYGTTLSFNDREAIGYKTRYFKYNRFYAGIEYIMLSKGKVDLMATCALS